MLWNIRISYVYQCIVRIMELMLYMLSLVFCLHIFNYDMRVCVSSDYDYINLLKS